jgi:hypothetical protein
MSGELGDSVGVIVSLDNFEANAEFPRLLNAIAYLSVRFIAREKTSKTKDEH